jgi:hypothetical protein
MFQSANCNFLSHWMLCCLLHLFTNLTVLHTRQFTESNIHSLHCITWKYILILIINAAQRNKNNVLYDSRIRFMYYKRILENIPFESYKVESTYVPVMVHRERKIQ